MDIGENINAENNCSGDEGHNNLCSCSDDDSTSTDEDSSDGLTDDEDEFKGLLEYDIVIKEQDFERNEKLSVGGDVYNYTICAFMTGCTSPIKKGYCLKQCFIVFSI